MKPALIGILLFLALIFCFQNAAAEVTSISPDNSVLPSQSVSFSYYLTDPAQNCTIAINGVNNQTGPTVQNQQNSVSIYLNEGQYSWSVSCAINSTTRVSSQTKQFSVDITPPNVALLTPPSTFNTTTVTLKYYVEGSYLDNCSLLMKLDGLMKDVKTDQNPVSGSNNTFSIALQDGQYEWNVRCMDRANNIGIPLFSGTFGVDTTPPVISGLSPSGVITGGTATLSLTTSEDAECRQSSSAQNLSSFSSMNSFSITGQKQHQQPLSFQNDGVYTYYIICRDKSGNANPYAQKFDINVHLLPSAKISFGSHLPLKSGIISVSIQTSKDMISAPYLGYTIAGKETPIVLSGQDDEWTGNILIDSSVGNQIGTFTFRGTDIQGYSGTTITEGASFVIDTLKPSAPESFKAEAENGSIILRWYSTSDDALEYRIYRSTAPAVDYMDIYETVNGTSLEDSEVTNKVTYYYRVAAIDDAGNLGDLSETVFATAHNSQDSSAIQESKPPAVIPLPPNLVVKVNDATKKVENIKLSIDAAASSMSELTGMAKQIESMLALDGQAAAANSKLGQLIGELDALKETYREEADLNNQLNSIIDEASKIELQTVREIRITGHLEDAPIAKKEKILEAINNAFSAADMPKNKQSYAAIDEKDIQNLQVKTSADIASIVMINGTSTEKTLISHSFTYTGTDPAQDSLAIITVPKTVAQSSTELMYPGGKPEIIKDDPILKWGFLSIGTSEQAITYIVNRKLSDDEIRSIDVIPLLNINKISQTATPATGLAVFQNIPKTGQIWLIIPGLLVILGLGGYYFATTRRTEKNDQLPPSEQISGGAINNLNDRLSTIQVEIDEEIYPMLSSIRHAVAAKNDINNEKVIDALVNTAKNYLRGSEVEKAKAVYPAIQTLYQLLSKEQKAKYGPTCIWLHQQIKRGN